MRPRTTIFHLSVFLLLGFVAILGVSSLFNSYLPSYVLWKAGIYFVAVDLTLALIGFLGNRDQVVRKRTRVFLFVIIGDFILGYFTYRSFLLASSELEKLFW